MCIRDRIYCNKATRELLELLLPDSAQLQEEQARYFNKHKLGKHKPAKPLYNLKHAKLALKQLKVFEKNERKIILPRWSIEAKRAGHILGSTSLCFEINEKVITFSGDIGRYKTPILAPPAAADFGDLVLCESTYGDRSKKGGDTEAELQRIVNLVKDKKGPLIIPAFAVGRTQTLLYYLAKLERENKIPTLPVYVDSPMAVNATRIYRRFKHDYDKESKELLEAGETPLLTENVHFCRSTKESKSLNTLRGPRIIISASGMLTGGRVLHHLKNNIKKPETTILFVGYQAEGTLSLIHI